MPSNAEYTKQAAELAAELSLEVETDGLNNQQLADLVSDLKAKKKDTDAAEDDDVTAKAMAKAAARKADKPQPGKKPPFYVAPRCAITSNKGILSGDTSDEVKAEYLAGGEKALQTFIDTGHILKG